MELPMAFQWLQMRIQEETERRERQAKNQERLPGALRDLHGHLAECIQDYTASFGCNSAEIVLLPDRIKVTVREEREGKWQALCKACHLPSRSSRTVTLIRSGSSTISAELQPKLAV